MSEIIIPTKYDKAKLGEGIITKDDKKEGERYQYFSENYDLVAHYVPYLYKTNPRLYVEDCELGADNISNKKKIDSESEALNLVNIKEVIAHDKATIINSHRYRKYIQPEKVCRFCGKRIPEVKFKKKAHAISELVGNKTVFLRNECDTCNAFFGEVYENSFSKFTGPMRAIAQTNGKDGVPVFEDSTSRIEVGYTSEVVQEVSGSNHFEFTDEGFVLHLMKQTYCPLDAYKALVLMALSIMPDREFTKFASTVDWIMKRGKFEEYDFKNYASNVIFRFVSGSKPLPVQVWLLRRKSHFLGGVKVYDVPYCQFILEFDNFSFQIIVPNYEQDAVLWNTTITVPAFISSFDYCPMIGQETSARIEDLSGREKVVGELDHIFMHVGKKIEQVDDLENSVQDIMNREGVKPLKPKRQ